MGNELVSIIMPAYNCECYIKKAIESVYNQTYESWELIVVNDGSSDDTENICKNYASKDLRIKYISQSNSGSSNARNTGLKQINGNYVAFLDSDDWYDTRFLEMMIDKLQSNESDVVMCDFCIDGKPEFSYSDKVLNGKEILSEFGGVYVTA